MDEKRLRELAGLLTEGVEANAMFSDMKEIGEEFRENRQGVRKILREMIKSRPRESKITADFLTDLLGTIFASQD
jgi:hypothetical protein